MMRNHGKYLLVICLVLSFTSNGQHVIMKTDRSLIHKEKEPVKEEAASCCTNGSCCDGTQTPLGVMTDHVHARGEWMASYMYMNMAMKGNRTGTSKTSDSAIFAKGYMMAPDAMTMQMHMAMLMYGVTNRFTLMAMFGYTDYKMSMNMSGLMIMPGQTEPSSTMKCNSSGWGDTRITGLYSIYQNANSRMIGALGISIPTGTIRAKGTTSLGTNMRMPYDMQPGTGSFSILPDVTYTTNKNKIVLGGNVGGDLKLNKNALGYQQGNNYHATLWAGYKVLSFVSASVRAEYLSNEGLKGSDKEMDSSYYQYFDPTTVTKYYGGKWINIYAGLNFKFDKPLLNKFQFQIEYGMPVYENLKGPQMSVHSNLLAGLSYGF